MSRMMRIFAVLFALPLVGAVACGGPADPGKSEPEKLDAKQKADVEARTEKSAAKEAKAERKGESPVLDAKVLDNNAQDTNTPPKNDTAGDVAPDSIAPTGRPPGVPEDWQRIAGDVWSFWVPKDWTVSDVKADDGSTKGDKSARRSRIESGVEVSDLSCTVHSQEALPTTDAELKKEVLKRAKAAAKQHVVETKAVKLELDEGVQDVLHLEYDATGDGTLVFERWVVSLRPLALVCSDESGTKDPANRKTLDTALDSLRWVVGD